MKTRQQPDGIIVWNGKCLSKLEPKLINKASRCARESADSAKSAAVSPSGE